MPSGPELARQLSSQRPELRVLCMSGYTDDAVLQDGILEAEMAFIQKPLTPERCYAGCAKCSTRSPSSAAVGLAQRLPARPKSCHFAQVLRGGPLPRPRTC